MTPEGVRVFSFKDLDIGGTIDKIIHKKGNVVRWMPLLIILFTRFTTTTISSTKNQSEHNATR